LTEHSRHPGGETHSSSDFGGAVSKTASLCDVATKMKEIDVGAIPVFEGDRLVGMVTDRDIVVRAVAAGKDPAETTAKEVMTEGVIYCFEDQDVGEAADVMENENRRLIALNREHRLVGIVSLGDLAAHADRTIAGRTLETVASAPPTEHGR
jgi:CBS domain-containing protein